MVKLLTWPCSECGGFIEDGTGYLHFRTEEMLAHHEAEVSHWTARMNGETELEPHAVEKAPWLFTHQKCDPAAIELHTRYDIADTRIASDLFELIADALKSPYAGHTAMLDLLYTLADAHKNESARDLRAQIP